MSNKKKTELFSRIDIRKVTETAKQSHNIMQTIDKWLDGKNIMTTIETSRKGEVMKATVSMRHYDLEKAIKFFESIVNLDA